MTAFVVSFYVMFSIVYTIQFSVVINVSENGLRKIAACLDFGNGFYLDIPI